MALPRASSTWEAKPITCLSAEDHHEVNDALTHYLGCIEVQARAQYYRDTSAQNITKIQTEFRRIGYLREVLKKTADKILIDDVVRDLQSWRNIKKKEIEAVKLLSRRGDVNFHDLKAEKEYPLHPHPGTSSTQYDADKDLKAYAMAFRDGEGVDIDSKVCTGYFPDQKISVDDLLRHKESPLKKEPVARNGPSSIRYYHLPSNNMQWVEEAMAKYYGEEGTTYDTIHKKAAHRTRANTLLHRDFWRLQENGREKSILHARHMRPFCEPLTSNPDLDRKTTAAENIVMFMPYLHWDTDLQRKSFAAIFDQKLHQQQKDRRKHEDEEYYERRRKRAHLYGKKPPPARRPKRTETQIASMHKQNPRGGHRTLADVTTSVIWKMFGRNHPNPLQLPRENGRLKIKDPLGKVLYDAAKLFEVMHSFRDRELIDKYLLKSSHIHARRTLDQAYFWGLRNTTTRDRDQVIYKKTSVRPEDIHFHDPPPRYELKEKENHHHGCAGETALPDHGQPPGTSSRPYLNERVRSLFFSKQDGGGRSHSSNENTDVESQQNGDTEPRTHHHDEEESTGSVCIECQEAIQKVPRLIMVDQLWMWVLDSETIITFFPRRYGVNRRDESGVYKSIRTRLANLTGSKMMSAYDLALIIITECSNVFFDPTNTDVRQPRLMDIFSETIGEVAQKQMMYFDHLWHWADELAMVATKQSSIFDVSKLHVALLNITKEGQLQRETKNIIEELGIMILLVKQQKMVITRFKKHAEALMDPRGHFRRLHQRSMSESHRIPSVSSPTSAIDQSQYQSGPEYEAWTEFRANADATLNEIDQHLEGLQALTQTAEQVSLNVDQLLAMKQQQAGVVQAWQAIRQGEEAVKQGRAIMIITIITIIFLPLAFMAGIFGMNNDLTKDDNMSFTRQLKLIFGVSVGVVTLVIVLAFNSFLRCLFWCATNYLLTWFLVHSGLYGAWFGLSETFKTEGLIKACEAKVSEMKGQVRLQKRRELADRYRSKMNKNDGEMEPQDAQDGGKA